MDMAENINTGCASNKHEKYADLSLTVLGSSMDDWATRLIASLLKWSHAKLYCNDQFFMVKIEEKERGHTSSCAFQYDKMYGIVRQPGLLIVQAPYESTNLSAANWSESSNVLLRFINAVYVCRMASKSFVQPGEFSDVLGGPEERLSTHLHATLIAGLSIISIVGGHQHIQRLVEAILGGELEPRQKSTGTTQDSWRILSRIKCPCESKYEHGPLTPLAAAKAAGLDIWKERDEEIVARVWDLQQDKLVKNVDARKVIFITHRWEDEEKEYSALLNTDTIQQSIKLRRIRDALYQYTKYVWIDTICIDKTNMVELDKAIRSMYKWYANCRAVVLDSGTPIQVWLRRGWCLQEGAAAGKLFGMYDGRLVSMKYLAEKQKTELCELDLSLYYRPGNAAEILSRMDRRDTTQIEDMAYALTGIFSINLTLAYGEGKASRERLLREIAVQKGDLSFLSFRSSQADSSQYLPMREDATFPITTCTVSSSPIMISHLGLIAEVNVVQPSGFKKVLDGLEFLAKYSKGRCTAIEKFVEKARNADIDSQLPIRIAIMHNIRTLMLVEIHGEDQQTGSTPIKRCHRLQCCQVETDEFERLYGNIGSKAERIWLGNKPVDYITSLTSFEPGEASRKHKLSSEERPGYKRLMF
jgi:hypothetical protein